MLDEAGRLAEITGGSLDALLVNLGSRMRGQIGGCKRMGKMIVMSTAEYDPELWERFDMAESLPQYCMSILATTYDNPYLTADQLGAIERRIKDPEKRKQLMKSERPLPRGNEFTPELLEPCQSREMDDVMRHARENNLRGYYVEEAQRAGTVLWVIPPNEFDRYVLIGDPGQNTPPDRNSGVVTVLKVTGFPQVPAEVAAFHWVDGQGSYWPFINQMEEWYRAYRPIYTAFDASGTQKGFDELVFAQKGMLVEGVQVNTNKMRVVVALKLILGKQKLLMPKEIQGIWMQLAGWRMPDTKLRQDIASCLFIAADVLNRLFIIDEEHEAEEDGSEFEDVAHVRRRPHRRKATRHQRTGGRVQR